MEHFLTLTDFTAEALQEILIQAEQLKRLHRRGVEHRFLAGQCLATVFEHPSTRTRVSFEVAMFQLGGTTINLSPIEIGIGKREPVSDLARVMSRYVNALMMRVSKHETLERFAEFSTVPVINGLSDRYHPCQAISDMLTIREKKGRIGGIRLVFVGDGNNVCVSLMHAATRLGVDMVVCCPKGYEPKEGTAGTDYLLVRDPEHAVEGADVIYTDVWTSMSDSDPEDKRQKDFRGYMVTKELLRFAKPDVIFMHCLPAHRGEEVEEAVVEGPHSVVFDQAENRLHVQKSVLVYLLKQAY